MGHISLHCRFTLRGFTMVVVWLYEPEGINTVPPPVPKAVIAALTRPPMSEPGKSKAFRTPFNDLISAAPNEAFHGAAVDPRDCEVLPEAGKRL
jgi:hypothetical protein